MKKTIATLAVAAALAGCTHEPPPIQELVPPDPAVADTVVVQEEVYEPVTVEPAQTPDSPAPENAVPPVENSGANENAVQPLENDGAADNSDPAVYVSPFAVP